MPPPNKPAAPNAAKSFVIFLASLVVLVGVGVGLGAVFFGPTPKKQYDRSTPDAMLEAARDMVVRNDAERLTELIYADSLEMEELYARLGVVLGHLQDLAVAINERFPEEIKAAQAKAQEEAKAGRGLSLLQQFNPSGRRNGPPSGEDSERWNQLLQAVATDPYGWLTDAEGRLSYTAIDDERVAVLWDGKPILPPLGLVMQQNMGEWSLVLPLKSLPMLSGYMPQTPNEYSIWGSILQAVDNVVLDLESDVREGKLESLDALARTTGQKAAPVMMGCMIAYDRAVRERRRLEREARDAAKAGQTPGQTPGGQTPGG
jgi:hypothetical protein